MTTPQQTSETLKIASQIHEGGSYTIKDGKPVKALPQPTAASTAPKKESK